jgi:hypothetical protein
MVSEIPFITISLEMGIRNMSGKTFSGMMCGYVFAASSSWTQHLAGYTLR